MIEVTEVEETEVEDEPLDVNKAAEAAAAAGIELPAGKGDFWTLLDQFTPDQWQNQLIAYLYRTDPKINRRSNGRATNIQKYSEKFDPDRIMLDHGSGGYRIDLNIRPLTGGGSRRIAQHYFEIVNMQHPPKVPPGDWIDEPVNEMWRWAAPAVKDGAQAIAYATGGHVDPNKVFETVLAGVERLAGPKGSGDSVTVALIQGMQQMQTMMMQMNDPMKQLQTLQLLLGKQSKEADPLIALIIAQNTNLQKELAQLRNTPQKGLLEQVRELLPVVTEFRNLMPSRGAQKEGGILEAFAPALERLADNLPGILSFMGNRDGNQAAAGNGFNLPAARRQAQPQAQAAAPPQQPQPQTQQPPTQQTTAAAGGTETVVNGAMPQDQLPEIPQELREHYQRILDKWGTLIRNIAPHMIDMYANETGYDFRDWFISRHGLNNWNAFRNDASAITQHAGNPAAETIAGMVELHNVLRAMMQPPERRLSFFTEFFTEQGAEPEGVVNTEAEES